MWVPTGEHCLIGMLISHTPPRFVSQCACHCHAAQPPISLLHPARCPPKYQSDKTTCTPVATAMSRPMYIICSPRISLFSAMDAPPRENPWPCLIQFCRSDGCWQLMGPLYVYLGAGDLSRRHLHGALVQLVSLPLFSPHLAIRHSRAGNFVYIGNNLLIVEYNNEGLPSNNKFYWRVSIPLLTRMQRRQEVVDGRSKHRPSACIVRMDTWPWVQGGTGIEKTQGRFFFFLDFEGTNCNYVIRHRSKHSNMTSSSKALPPSSLHRLTTGRSNPISRCLLQRYTL